MAQEAKLVAHFHLKKKKQTQQSLEKKKITQFQQKLVTRKSNPLYIFENVLKEQMNSVTRQKKGKS